MRNNRTLITEIERIRELMGKKLLNEQWKQMSNIILNLGDEFTELLSRNAEDISELGKALSEDEALKILSKLANKERKFADLILPEVMKNLPDNISKEVSEIISMGKKQLEGKTPKTTVDKLVSNKVEQFESEFSGLRDLIKKHIDDELTGYKPVSPAVKPSNLEDIDQMRLMIQDWKKIIPQGLSTKDWILLNNLPLRRIRAVMNYTVNNILNQRKLNREKSLEKIVGLLKSAANKLGKAEQNTQLYKTINQEIESLRNSEDFDTKIIYEILKKELNPIIGYNNAEKIISGAEKNITMGKDADSFWKYLMNEDYIGQLFKKQSFASYLHRAASTLLTGMPMKIDELSRFYLTKYGIPKGLKYLYFRMMLMNKIWWPIAVSLADLFMYPFNKEQVPQYEGLSWDTYKQLFKENFKNMFLIYDEEVDKASSQIGVPEKEINYWKSILQSINPAHLMADDFIDWVMRGFDYHVAGTGVAYVRKKTKEVEEKVKNQIDSTGLEIGLDQLILYKNTKSDFEQFGLDAGYTPEEVQNFDYDEMSKTGTTSDDKKYQWVKDDKKEGFGLFKKF